MSAQKCQLYVLGVILLGLPSLLGAQDVVHFQNGDRLTGTVKRLDHGQIVFSSSTFDGDAFIDWRRVEHIESDRTFQFETSSGERFLGRIVKGGTDEEVLIVSAERERLLRQDEIVLATQTVAGLTGLLEASVGAGMTLSKSNNQKQSNADANISYETPRYLATATVSSIFSTQQDAPSTNRQNLTLGLSRHLSRKWSATVLADFLISEEQQLDLRTILGGGPTRRFVSSNRLMIYAVGGAVWNVERYSPESGLLVNKQLEGLAAFGVEYFQFRQWTAESVFRLFPSITTAGRVRADWRTNLRLRVRRDKPLWWNFNYTINLDNRPPANTPGTDYITSSSLSWSFP